MSAGAIVGAVAAMTLAAYAQEPRWFSAWSAAHNVGLVVEGLNGGSVRLVVRPTLSGQSLRVKLTNIRGNTPAVFSSAFVGVAGEGATVVPGTNRRLTFRGGAQDLTLAPDESAWSDAVAFDVKAFQRLAVSLDITSASDVSMDTLALVTTYRAAGYHAAETSANGFAPIPPNAPDSRADEYPMYWLAALDVDSPSAAGTIVAVATPGSMVAAARLKTGACGQTSISDGWTCWRSGLRRSGRRNRAPSSTPESPAIASSQGAATGRLCCSGSIGTYSSAPA